MRLVLTLRGRVVLDLAILDDEPEPDESADGDIDALSVLADTARIGFVDDVGAGSTFPWE